MSSPQSPGTPGSDRQAGSLLLDRYQIERVIGEGAYGRVYLAMDTRLRRNVAIKELLAGRAQTEPAHYAQYLARFEREARATGIIQQPNVVAVYDLHTDDAGNNYLVVEYVDGTNLRDLLAQVGTLPASRAVAIATDIAKALEAVHERGIVHRDVKPANIMISRRGAAKLTEFGIALVAGEQQVTTMAGGHPGTPGYMSPEQTMAYGPLDGRSDLYSLGLVLYEMLVGEPFARRQQPLEAVRPEMPAALIALVDRLLAPAADARYQSATDLLADLQALDVATISQQPMPSAPPLGMAPPGSFPPGAAPTAYGAPPSQPPGATPGAYPAPPPAMPPAMPPLAAASGYGGGTMPPVYPGQMPPRKSNRGVLFGILGAVVGVAVIAGAIFAFTHRGGGGAATATPAVGAATPTAARVTSVANATTAPTATPDTGVFATPTRAPTIAAGSATALATPTPAGSATAAVTATATRPAATPSAAPAALTETWADPDGLIAMKFPNGWQQGKDSSDPSNRVEFTSSNGPVVDVYLDDPQQGSLADEIQIITRNQANSQKYNYTNQPVQDLTIGGEPAKMIAFTYTDKSDPSKSFLGAYWEVNHEGRQYTIAASPIGSSRATLDAMIASITFPKAKVTTWLDPDKVIRTRYPNEWTASSDKDNALILNGANDEIHIFVDIVSPGSTTIDQEFKSIRDSGSDDGKTVRTYDPVTDTKVGGQPAKSMAYKYAPKSNPSATTGTATIWIVDYKGKRYEFFCSNISLHRPEIEAFMNSVAFIK